MIMEDYYICGQKESSVSTSNKKFEGKGGKQQNFHPFFSKFAAWKKKNKDYTQQKSQDVVYAVVPVKQAKGGEDQKKKKQKKEKVNESKVNKEWTASAIQSAFVGDSSELSVCKSRILAQLKKIFNDIDESRWKGNVLVTMLYLPH